MFVFWDAVVFLILFKQLCQTLETQKHMLERMHIKDEI